MMGANLLLPLSGLVLAALAWAAGSVWLAGVTPIAASFAPLETARALLALLQGAELWEHVAVSLERCCWGFRSGCSPACRPCSRAARRRCSSLPG